MQLAAGSSTSLPHEKDTGHEIEHWHWQSGGEVDMRADECSKFPSESLFLPATCPPHVFIFVRVFFHRALADANP